MIQRAIEKIDNEMGENPNSYETYIADYLKDNLTPTAAEKILNPEKTIKGCYISLEDVAKRKKTGNCYAMPPSEVHSLIRQYYGLDRTASSEAYAGSNKVVNIMDLI